MTEAFSLPANRLLARKRRYSPSPETQRDHFSEHTQDAENTAIYFVLDHNLYDWARQTGHWNRCKFSDINLDYINLAFSALQYIEPTSIFDSSKANIDHNEAPLLIRHTSFRKYDDDLIYFSADKLSSLVSKLERSAKPQELIEATKHVTINPELPLSSEFVPSKELLNLWVQSLNSYIDEAADFRAPESQLWDPVRDRNELQSNFWINLRDVIIRFALVKGVDQRKFRLSISHRFTPTFMAQVAEKFLVRPDDGTMFFRLLFSELRDWFSKGRKFSGKWGMLDIDISGDFILYVSQYKRIQTRGFKPSDED